MKKRLVLVLAVLGALLLSACGQDSGYETIGIDEVAAKQEAGFTVLDVREAYEYEQGHIPEAENKPLSLLQSDDFEGLQKDAKYVVICQSGNRSKEASELLQEEGYEFVNVAQGMSSWEGAVE